MKKENINSIKSLKSYEIESVKLYYSNFGAASCIYRGAFSPDHLAFEHILYVKDLGEFLLTISVLDALVRRCCMFYVSILYFERSACRILHDMTPFVFVQEMWNAPFFSATTLHIGRSAHDCLPLLRVRCIGQ